MPRLVSSRPVSRAVLPVPQAGGYRQCVPTPFNQCPPIMVPPPPPLPQPMMIPQYPMPQVSSRFAQFCCMPKRPCYNGGKHHINQTHHMFETVFYEIQKREFITRMKRIGEKYVNKIPNASNSLTNNYFFMLNPFSTR